MTNPEHDETFATIDDAMAIFEQRIPYAAYTNKTGGVVLRVIGMRLESPTVGELRTILRLYANRRDRNEGRPNSSGD